MDFRNNTTEEWSISNWWDNGNNQIAFGRGEYGFVAINKENGSLNATLQTGLAGGTYCNVLKGQLNSDGQSCSDETIVVNADGSINANLASWDAFAIHHNAKTTTTPPVINDWQRTVVFI